MSFGYSVTDFITLGTIAWKVWKTCKSAPDSFSNLSQEVLSLHAVLKEAEETLFPTPLSDVRRARLKTVADGCHSVLVDIQALVDKYHSLGTQTKRTWDRLGWARQDCAELRARLTSNTALLTAYIATSQVVVGQILETYAQESRHDGRPASTVSVKSLESLSPDDKQTWRAIRKDLEDIGISVAAFDANKDFIIRWLTRAFVDGEIEEEKLEGFAPKNLRRRECEAVETPGSARSSPSEAVTFCHVEKHSPATDDTPSPPLRHQAPANSSSLGEQPLSTALTDIQRPLSAMHQARDGPIGRLDYLQANRPRMHKAILRGDCGAVHDMLVSGEEPGAPSRAILDEGLLYALWKNQTKVASLFIDHGADPNSADYSHGTALHLAVENESPSLVGRLINNGADVNGHPYLKESALQIASRLGDQKTVALLIEGGADVNFRDWRGSSALREASEAGNTAIVKVLLEGGAEDNAAPGFEGSALIVASSEGHTAIVRMLIANGADVNAKSDWDGSALGMASEGGYEDVVRLLIANGADVNANSSAPTSALALASRAGCKDIVRLLIANGANVNAGYFPYASTLALASEEGHEAVVRILIVNGADVNAWSSERASALALASREGHEAVVQVLMANGADVNAIIDDGCPPVLVLASREGHEAVVRILIANGADVNAEDKAWGSALQAAVEAGHEKVVRALIEKGANVNIRGGNLDSPLEIALSEGYHSIARLLRDHGAIE
ncbi:MAG: hypothetical protein M1817_005831 [Caeruleum heppii]|nr:MAG: hypothetical protein M1817_005831 [Caeruleum heppii]